MFIRSVLIVIGLAAVGNPAIAYCRKPPPPGGATISNDDDLSYSSCQSQMMHYKLEIKSHLSCLKREDVRRFEIEAEGIAHEYAEQVEFFRNSRKNR